ncbi:MAG: HNH endonuclease [Phycisphaerales bacterium]|nr:MAG: HNH endonuclease [Phycisphaerales bacterium]
MDPEDYRRLARHKWSAAKQGKTSYAVRAVSGVQIRMHREITAAPEGLVCDHIDHNGLNNTKANLRICSKSENARNQRPQTDCSSKYKGVCWHKNDRRWHARIHHNRRRYHLGSFKDEIEAAGAYDKAAKEHHGEFACLNLSQDTKPEPVRRRLGKGGTRPPRNTTANSRSRTSPPAYHPNRSEAISTPIVNHQQKTISGQSSPPL